MAKPTITGSAGFKLKMGKFELSLTLSLELKSIALLYIAQYFLA